MSCSRRSTRPCSRPDLNPLRALADALSPRRLGSPFRWFLASSWTGNLGDGLALAAGPLLVASVTTQPAPVAASVLLQRLPWVLFGLHAGVVADRLDRRTVVAVANALRAVVLAALAATIASGAVSVPVVLTTMFLLGTAETFADTAGNAVVPMLVARADLGIANARIMGGSILTNQLLGPPIGAALFAAGRVWPFVAQGVLVALAALVLLRITLPTFERSTGPRRVGAEIREGWRWVAHHPPVRTLAITILTFNVTWGCAWSVLVLYADQRLGLGAVGFGLITTVGAVGGLLATVGYGPLERRVPLAVLMRGVLLVETLVHLALALTTSPALALVVFGIFGAEAFTWGTLASTVRQRAVPAEVQGRVGGVYMLGVMGGLVIGAALAGPLAHAWGITAPFWFAFAGSGVVLALLWRSLGHVAHADEQARESDVGIAPV